MPIEFCETQDDQGYMCALLKLYAFQNDMVRLHDEYIQIQENTENDINVIQITDTICDQVFGSLHARRLRRSALLPIVLPPPCVVSSLIFSPNPEIDQMAGFSSLSPRMKNFIVAGGLSGFVVGVYFYTMRAVSSTDELQVAIDKFEQMKGKNESGESSTSS
ncbi:hypothetical protein ZIOFF_017069 [Zingiber officinale]|uniref:Cytochrome c oxidase assembly factor 3 mitochondrial coiled-coil domain-containing protein n=2 Tax=Zingiber officinale TaxID=94328 RepID=A0A8J5H4B2_ZINOF|nr:hypothetical protein ZIOFF_017069 [Zingiber officinale]